jgi:hypothetical protein
MIIRGLLTGTIAASLISTPSGLDRLPPRGKVIPSVFEKASTPVGVLLSKTDLDGLREESEPRELLRNLVPAGREAELTYVLLSQFDSTRFACALLPHPPDSDCTPDDPYHVELTTVLRSSLTGSRHAEKPAWVRTTTTDLAALGIPLLRGGAVAAAFSPRQIEASRYVVMYRTKHWPKENHSSNPDVPDRCGGHTHQEARWGIIPS